MSEPERRSGFYKQWEEHIHAGGENSQEEWEKLGRAWKLSEIPKKQPPGRSYVGRPRAKSIFDGSGF